MTAVADRVAAGAAFLDEHDPQWWRPDVERAIDLDRLDLEIGDRCILGQRCPMEVYNAAHVGDSYYYAMAASLSGIRRGPDLDDWAMERGFYFDEDVSGRDDQYDALTGEWKRVITERRAAA